MADDGHRLLLDLDDLHFDVVRPDHVRDARHVAAAGEPDVVLDLHGCRCFSGRDHLVAAGFELVDRLPQVRHREPEMIDRASAAPARRHSGVHEQQRVRELHDLPVLRADRDGRAAQRVDPELFVIGHARDNEVVMAVDDWAILGRQQLRRRVRRRRRTR